MAKDILAFLGLVFLTLLIVVLLAVIGYYYDALGLVKLPEAVPTRIARILGPRAVTVQVVGIGLPEWHNPLDDLPRSTEASPTVAWQPTPVPLPSATPILPLDAAVYRTEVIFHLKDFVSALERWLEDNKRLAQDNTLISDAVWRAGMSSVLVEIGDSGRAMAEVGPPPTEYAVIARLLDRVAESASSLETHYGRALETHSPEDFEQAGDDFERVKAYLTEVVTAMIAQGWSLE